MTCIRPCRLVKAVLFLSLLSFVTSASAASSGSVKARLVDQAGQPLGNVLVSLLQSSSPSSLPILARTDGAGLVSVRNVNAGRYQILVKSASYRIPQKHFVQVTPGETSFVTLILQQFWGLEGGEGPNVNVKTLLQLAGERRLIFRNLPGQGEEEGRELPGYGFESASVQMFTSGASGDFFRFPTDPSSGTTTNFAVVHSLGLGSEYVFAGQINSGEDSLWRLKNVFRFNPSDRHSYRVMIGYGQVSFDHANSSLWGNPESIASDLSTPDSVTNTRLMSLGFEDQWILNSAVSFLWGVELDRVRSLQSHSFLNPRAELTLLPGAGSTIHLMVASKRNTRANAIEVQDGQVFNLSDAVGLSRVGNQVEFGSSRYVRASFEHPLGKHAEVEVAAFRNQLFPGSFPIVTRPEEAPGQARVLQLSKEAAESSGYRVTLRRRLGDHFRASASYLFGDATQAPGSTVVPLQGALLVDDATLQRLLQRKNFHLISTTLEALIPVSRTQITAVVKMAPGGNPLTTVDAFADPYDTSNEGINLFIRQAVPISFGFLNAFGLDFLSPERVEALLDIRDLTNQNLGVLHTPEGNLLLVRNPRSVRGGIAVRF